MPAAAAIPVVDRPPARTPDAAGLPDDAVPRQEPRSRYGNGPIYEVLGQTYRVLDTSHGYKEQGVASWYGQKFHGRMTSNQERYDMYAMTAAHKTLPLPTYVRVRNLKNNRSIVVRVNDRGPFVHNRLIDLSYSAALKLDLVNAGTGLVEVEAISFDDPAGELRASSGSQAPAASGAADVFVQVGAFGEIGNAKRQYDRLRMSNLGRVLVVEEQRGGEKLYRVRIGPIDDVGQYDVIVDRLRSMGIDETYLVAD